jgi:glycine C-acetyltransferase
VDTKYHEHLREWRLFVMKESAYLLNFGYQGIMSTIDALVTKNDIVYDVDAHACIDYVLVERYTYKHNDLESMEKTCNVLQKWLLKQVVDFIYYRRCFGMRGQQGK